jgi:hypothetical protein
MRREIYDPPYKITPASPGEITIPGDDWAAAVALAVKRKLQERGGYVRIICEHANGSGEWEEFMSAYPVGGMPTPRSQADLKEKLAQVIGSTTTEETKAC